MDNAPEGLCRHRPIVIGQNVNNVRPKMRPHCGWGGGGVDTKRWGPTCTDRFGKTALPCIKQKLCPFVPFRQAKALHWGQPRALYYFHTVQTYTKRLGPTCLTFY